MILVTLMNKINKHRNIFSEVYGHRPDKIILSVDALYLLKSKMLFELTEMDGDFFLMGMLVIKNEKLSQYDFLLK